MRVSVTSSEKEIGVPSKSDMGKLGVPSNSDMGKLGVPSEDACQACS